MAYSDKEEDDNDDDYFEPERPSRRRNGNTPVIDSFSQSFESIIENELGTGIEYYHRVKESNLLLKALLRSKKPHIAIVGEFGTGKETLVRSVAYSLSKGMAGMTLEKLKFLKFDLDALMAGTKYTGQLESRIKAIEREVQNADNIVFFSRDIDTISGFNPLFALLKTKAKFIIAFDPKTATDFFRDHSSMHSIFSIVKLSSTSISETIEVLNKHDSRIKAHYSVDLEENFIENLVEISNLYFSEDSEPLKSLSILEDVCATMVLNRISDPDDAIYTLRMELNRERERLDIIVKNKSVAVKAHNFEKAASFRDEEKNINELIENLKKNIEKREKEIRQRVTINNLVDVVSALTNIDKAKILKRETVDIKSEKNFDNKFQGLPQFEILQTKSILHEHRVLIKKGLAFVLIPHNDEFDDLFNHCIKPALEVHNLIVLKADNIYKPGNILSQVWAQIRTAELIIADVSGQNPNVIFELGLCYGVQRCPILLTREPAELPFNLRNLRYIKYDNSVSGAHKLKEDLSTSVGEFISTVRADET